jgi:hypothetical protein
VRDPPDGTPMSVGSLPQEVGMMNYISEVSTQSVKDRLYKLLYQIIFRGRYSARDWAEGFSAAPKYRKSAS